ncbi:acid phosphatase [Penaeus vannamei]|uniref:Acid phosphatase n=1 Tax=Penaeus vannamei TaxID=6689 RepID=A0A3R7PLU7_PENVA|nr:acid phosphatase [Penaeus vannamei]
MIQQEEKWMIQFRGKVDEVMLDDQSESGNAVQSSQRHSSFCEERERQDEVLYIMGYFAHFEWLLLTSAENRIDDYQPQHVHIVIGETSKDMVITWTTFTDTPSSVVEYGMLG